MQSPLLPKVHQQMAGHMRLKKVAVLMPDLQASGEGIRCPSTQRLVFLRRFLFQYLFLAI
jgi:hypothetical protein